jgi:outer membrane biosynthesis protein TonB
MMIETTAPFYPSIAKAAHLSGNFILRVTFKTSGTVEKLTSSADRNCFARQQKHLF